MARLDNIGNVVLNQNEIDIMLSLCGGGDLLHAETLFFGIEEGLGRNTPLNKVNELLTHYGQNYAICNKKTKLEGHYHIIPRGGEPFPSSEYLRYSARIMLHLGNPKVRWCAPLGNDTISKTIRDYYKLVLYRETKAPKSGLFEWGFLPRKNMGTWPYAPGIIDREQYEVFFNLGHGDRYHIGLRNKRIQILNNLFKCTSANRVIGFGKKDLKKDILEIIFPGIIFRNIVCGSISIWYAKHHIYKRDIEFFLCPFPGTRKGYMNLPSLCDFLKLL